MHFDRSHWPPGPWMDEPDRVEFEHAGFPCILNRGPSGAWCGYVGVPPEHPYYKKHHGSAEHLQVHGGLTYSHECQGEVCHVAPEGETDHRWWFGFDCMHYRDWAPEHSWAIWTKLNRPEFCRMPGEDGEGEYRDVHYVRAETARLAEQLK